MTSHDEIRKMIDELRRVKTENDELKKRFRPVTFEVTERGAISVYGLGKKPQTLYKSQWEKIIDHEDDLKTFIKNNEQDLN